MTEQPIAEIKKIVMTIGKKEIIMTVDEAKQLKAALNELFGKEIIKEIRVEKECYKPFSWPYKYGIGDQVICGAQSQMTTKYDNSQKALYCAVN